jgi:hypothetical protein
MGTVAIPANGSEALCMLESAVGFLARMDPMQLPDGEAARYLRVMEHADAIEAAARGRLLQAFDARDGHLADGQRTIRAWLVHSLRVTRGQAAEHKAVQALARDHGPLIEALAEGHVVAKSIALQLAKWTRPIPAEYRGPGRGDPGRGGPGRRRSAVTGADLRGDPLPHRPAGSG